MFAQEQPSWGLLIHFHREASASDQAFTVIVARSLRCVPMAPVTSSLAGRKATNRWSHQMRLVGFVGLQGWGFCCQNAAQVVVLKGSSRRSMVCQCPHLTELPRTKSPTGPFFCNGTVLYWHPATSCPCPLLMCLPQPGLRAELLGALSGTACMEEPERQNENTQCLLPQQDRKLLLGITYTW